MNLSKSKVGSSPCQCTTTLHGENKETQKSARKIQLQFRIIFTLGRWSSWEPGSEKKWYGTYSDKPDEDWDKTAEQMMLNLAESSHPIFRATSALERGELRKQSKGKEVSSLQR